MHGTKKSHRINKNQSLDFCPSKSILIKNKNTKSKKNYNCVSFSPYIFMDTDKNIYEEIKTLEINDPRIIPMCGGNLKIFRDNFTLLEKMGKIYYFTIQYNIFTLNENEKNENQLVGFGSAILINYSLLDRNIRLKTKRDLLYWYLSDFKIEKNHRGNNLTAQLFTMMFNKFSDRSRRGYLITSDKQIIHIMEKMNKMIGYKSVQITLLIYYVSAEKMETIERFFSCAFGSVSYISLEGTNNYVLDKNNTSVNPTLIGNQNRVYPDGLNIYHLQYGSFASKSGTVSLCDVPGDATIMFCFPDNSSLKNILQTFGFSSNDFLTILSWGMSFFDWHEILTSNI